MKASKFVLINLFLALSTPGHASTYMAGVYATGSVESHNCLFEEANVISELRERYDASRKVDGFAPNLVMVHEREFYLCARPTMSKTSCTDGLNVVNPVIRVREHYDAFKLVRGCRDLRFIGLRKENLPKPPMAN